MLSSCRQIDRNESLLYFVYESALEMHNGAHNWTDHEKVDKLVIAQ